VGRQKERRRTEENAEYKNLTYEDFDVNGIWFN
jgi:hypothetical protein